MKINKYEDKYLSFNIGNQVCAIHLNCVYEILGDTRITKIKPVLKNVEGFIELGKMKIPVLNLREKLNIYSVRNLSENYLILISIKLDNKIFKIGVLIDTLNEIFELSKAEMDSALSSSGEILQKLKGFKMACSSVSDIYILDIYKIFTYSELKSITGKALKNKVPEQPKVLFPVYSLEGSMSF